MSIIRRSNCVPLPVLVCLVVAVVMLESRVARFMHCVENVADRDLIKIFFGRNRRSKYTKKYY